MHFHFVLLNATTKQAETIAGWFLYISLDSQVRLHSTKIVRITLIWLCMKCIHREGG